MIHPTPSPEVDSLALPKQLHDLADSLGNPPDVEAPELQGCTADEAWAVHA